MTSLYGKIDTIVIEDIHTSFLWNTSVRMKFLKQIQQIAKHSNIIVSIDTFGIKVPKVWIDTKSWNRIIFLSSPSPSARMSYCKNHSILSKLGDSHLSFIIETSQDTSFRSLDRVARFLEQNERKDGVITFSTLRQAVASIGSVYLPPGLFKNATSWFQNPSHTHAEIAIMYDEDPFHFPYIIWNTLPQLCYHNGKKGANILLLYELMLDSLMLMDDPLNSVRVNECIKMYHLFHKGWIVRESILFKLPNIRNKISYGKVREKTLLQAIEQTHIPPMFVLNRIREDSELKGKLPQTIISKIK